MKVHIECTLDHASAPLSEVISCSVLGAARGSLCWAYFCLSVSQVLGLKKLQVNSVVPLDSLGFSSARVICIKVFLKPAPACKTGDVMGMFKCAASKSGSIPTPTSASHWEQMIKYSDPSSSVKRQLSALLPKWTSESWKTPFQSHFLPILLAFIKLNETLIF